MINCNIAAVLQISKHTVTMTLLNGKSAPVSIRRRHGKFCNVIHHADYFYWMLAVINFLISGLVNCVPVRFFSVENNFLAAMTLPFLGIRLISWFIASGRMNVVALVRTIVDKHGKQILYFLNGSCDASGWWFCNVWLCQYLMEAKKIFHLNLHLIGFNLLNT